MCLRCQIHFRWGHLSVRWSKVIQFRECNLQIPLQRIPNSAFCPINVLLGMFIECPPPSGPVPFFCYKENSSCLPLTQVSFTKRLHEVLQSLGFSPDKYSNHSFRRGGASFALNCGLPVDLIKLQGYWKSNAYERYLEPFFGLRQQVAATLGKSTSTFLSKTQHWAKSQMTEWVLASISSTIGTRIVYIFTYMYAS